MWACFYVYASQLADFLIIGHGQQINSVTDADESKKWPKQLLLDSIISVAILNVISCIRIDISMFTLL